MYMAWYKKVLRRRLHCSVKIADQAPISRKLWKPLWLTKAFLVNRCSLKIGRSVYAWNFFYPLLWCEPLLFNIKNMSFKHVCSHNWGLRLNCYGLSGAKSFRDLRETGLWVVAKKNRTEAMSLVKLSFTFPRKTIKVLNSVRQIPWLKISDFLFSDTFFPQKTPPIIFHSFTTLHLQKRLIYNNRSKIINDRPTCGKRSKIICKQFHSGLK